MTINAPHKYIDIAMKSLSKTASLNNNNQNEMVDETIESGNKDDYNQNEINLNGSIISYKRRWLILITYCLMFTLNIFHLTLYADLQNALINFYYSSFSNSKSNLFDNSYTISNWLFIMHMIINLVFIFPAMFILDYKGFRITFLTGSILTALGSWIKCNSIKPNFYMILILGQILCSIGFAFIQSCLVKLSALWFGKNETATAISVFFFLFNKYKIYKYVFL